MSRFFTNYEECEQVIISMVSEFSDVSQKRILLAINASKVLNTDAEKIYRIMQSMYRSLWDKPEAVDMGFVRWCDKHFALRKDALMYHSNNCNGECRICIEMKIMRGRYERKRPQICKK